MSFKTSSKLNQSRLFRNAQLDGTKEAISKEFISDFDKLKNLRLAYHNNCLRLATLEKGSNEKKELAMINSGINEELKILKSKLKGKDSPENRKNRNEFLLKAIEEKNRFTVKEWESIVVRANILFEEYLKKQNEGYEK